MFRALLFVGLGAFVLFCAGCIHRSGPLVSSKKIEATLHKTDLDADVMEQTMAYSWSLRREHFFDHSKSGLLRVSLLPFTEALSVVLTSKVVSEYSATEKLNQEQTQQLAKESLKEVLEELEESCFVLTVIADLDVSVDRFSEWQGRVKLNEKGTFGNQGRFGLVSLKVTGGSDIGFDQVPYVQYVELFGCWPERALTDNGFQFVLNGDSEGFPSMKFSWFDEESILPHKVISL